MDFRRSHLGTIRPVLWESERPAKSGELAAPTWFGHTDNYIPVYMNASNLLNRVTPAQLSEVYDDGVWGSAPREAE